MDMIIKKPASHHYARPCEFIHSWSRFSKGGEPLEKTASILSLDAMSADFERIKGKVRSAYDQAGPWDAVVDSYHSARGVQFRELLKEKFREEQVFERTRDIYKLLFKLPIKFDGGRVDSAWDGLCSDLLETPISHLGLSFDVSWVPPRCRDSRGTSTNLNKLSDLKAYPYVGGFYEFIAWVFVRKRAVWTTADESWRSTAGDMDWVTDKVFTPEGRRRFDLYMESDSGMTDFHTKVIKGEETG